MRDAARELARVSKASAQELATELADFAVTIATANGSGQRTSGRQASLTRA